MNEILPIMLALYLMLSTTYYAQNYAGIIGLGLDMNNVINTVMHTCNSHGMLICAVTCSVVIYMAIVKKLVQQVPLT